MTKAQHIKEMDIKKNVGHHLSIMPFSLMKFISNHFITSVSALLFIINRVCLLLPSGTPVHISRDDQFQSFYCALGYFCF